MDEPTRALVDRAGRSRTTRWPSAADPPDPGQDIMLLQILRRTATLVASLVVSSMLVFVFMALLPGDPAYGQLRIVGYRSTDADNDCIDQSPQSVEVGQSGRPIDVF